MNRFQNHALAIASISVGLLAATSSRAASLTQVSRSTWAGSVTLPSYVQMYIYVPDKLAAKPPIMVSSHSCGSTATGQMGNIPKIQAAADKNGFILILPDNPGQNCWDVGAASSLKHDGGGDTQAVAVMVKYAITKYSADPTRVYAMGGSSGAMMTQALMAVYPDVFRAGHARAGVPAGCWADSYKSGDQWSDTCAGGSVNKTAQQWGDLVRGMYSGYTGHRPRIQLMQGESDATISYKNMGESIEEWTNVLSLSTEPTSKDTGFKGQVSTYDRQFWKNACDYVVLETWSAPGQGHSMGYEEDAVLKFFGLDTASTADPEPDCPGGTGTGGTSGGAGAPGAGGKTGGVGGSQATTTGAGGVTGRGGAGNGGAIASAGRSSGKGGASATTSSGAAETGGRSAIGGANAKGGSINSNGSTAVAAGGSSVGTSEASGGSSAKGGSNSESSGGVQPSGGSSARGGSTSSSSTSATDAKGGSSNNTDATIVTTPDTNPSSGCSCVVASSGQRSAFQVTALLAALGLVLRRQRRSRA